MTVSDLQATVDIGGNSMSGHIISVEREHSLDRIGQTFTVMLDASTTQNINPWDTVVITENGVTVLTGYVDTVVVEREPSQLIVSGMDNWKRALDYFLDDNIVTANETVGYWIDYLTGLAGIAYTAPSLGLSLLVGDDVPMGLRPVSDALFTMATRALWNMRMLADGTLEFAALSLGAPDHDLTVFERGEYEVADRETRNVVKVWGWDDNPDSPGGSMLDIESRTVIGVDQERIMVFANPMIDTAAEAQVMATAALDHFANLDKESRVDLSGDPAYLIGDVGLAEVLAGVPHTQFITDMRMITDGEGYKANITLGRKNFLLPFFEGIPDFPIEDGLPTTEWEVESVPGIAKDTYVFGDHVYTVGNHTGLGGYIEKRLCSSGSLVWAKDISGTTNLHGVWVDATAVYILGHVGEYLVSPISFVLAELNDSDGSQNWSATELMGITVIIATSHLRGDANGLYMLGGGKGWAGPDHATRCQKRSRVDGSLIWQSSNVEPDPTFPGFEWRYFYDGVDAAVDLSDDVIVVGGSTGGIRQTTASTASTHTRLRIAHDKSTGTVLWRYVEHAGGEGPPNLGKVFDVSVDRFINGFYWGQGSSGPTVSQRLAKFTAAGDSVVVDGPDTSVTGTAMRTAPGMLYHYDLWEKSGVYTIRATSKGTLVTIWDEIIGHVTLGLHFWEFGPSIFHCGQRNSNFFTARWNI